MRQMSPASTSGGDIFDFRRFTVKPHKSNPKDDDGCLGSRIRNPFSDCESADEAIAEGTDRRVYHPFA